MSSGATSRVTQEGPPDDASVSSPASERTHSAGTRPLATLVLYAFNEQKYVREAVESALRQDYSPLEIVLSDDGSTDDTWQIMSELARAYDGPHEIILNRNKQQVGIGSQLNAAVRMTQGQLIVLANADDRSLPERVRRLVEVWQESGCRLHAITHDVSSIDSSGHSLGVVSSTATRFDGLEDGVRRRMTGVLAASLALSREVFDAFGPLPDDLVLEDNPLYLRAVLLGDVLDLPEPLVEYRIHDSNISHAIEHGDFADWQIRYRRARLWQRREGVKAYLQMLRDLHQSAAATHWPAPELERARWAAMERLLATAIERDALADDRTVPLLERARTLLRLGNLIAKVAVRRLFPALDRRRERRRWANAARLEGEQR